jgi:hypothetical protein
MLWGVESHAIERFGKAGVSLENISFLRDTWVFNFSGTPVELVNIFRRFYGPTMNAFEAAEKSGRAEELQLNLEELFKSQNRSTTSNVTTIPATFLRITVDVPKQTVI